MPNQTTDSVETIAYTKSYQTWIISGGVSVSTDSGAAVSSTNLTQSVLVNHGTLASALDGVIFKGGAQAGIVNAVDGVIVGDDGVFMANDYSSVQNFGLISGRTTGVYFTGAQSTLSNSGHITGGTTGYSENSTSASRVVNSGTIEGTGFTALYLTATYGTSNVVNSGVLQGAYNSIYMGSSGVLDLNNSGQMYGAVELFGERMGSSIVNSGEMTGDIRFGTFDDLYNGRNGSHSGTVFGNEGNDKLIGGAGDEVFNGGLGRDRFDGGAGDDTFVFTDVKESRPAAFDIITRHWHTGDQLDLTAIDANAATAGIQSVTFGGLVSAGAALATGKVSYYQSGGDTFVVLDTSGDGASDFTVRVNGLHTLTAADFIH